MQDCVEVVFISKAISWMIDINKEREIGMYYVCSLTLLDDLDNLMQKNK